MTLKVFVTMGVQRKLVFLMAARPSWPRSMRSWIWASSSDVSCSVGSKWMGGGDDVWKAKAASGKICLFVQSHLFHTDIQTLIYGFLQYIEAVS